MVAAAVSSPPSLDNLDTIIVTVLLLCPPLLQEAALLALASTQPPTPAPSAMLGRRHRVARRPASLAPQAGWLLLGRPHALSARRAPMHLPVAQLVWTVTPGPTLVMAQTHVWRVSLAPSPPLSPLLAAPPATLGNPLDTALECAMTAGLVPLPPTQALPAVAHARQAPGRQIRLPLAHHVGSVLLEVSARWPHVTLPRGAPWCQPLTAHPAGTGRLVCQGSVQVSGCGGSRYPHAGARTEI
jgi:hypothetical protein